jgi:CDP-diacylglycerol--glycerol-3-phosphate 3-phosphatidyltransferase
MKMNLPNRLTVMRMALIPFCILFIMLEGVIDADLAAFIAALIFAAASVTDALDGKIARKYGLVTDFGKFLDPLADKFLVIGCMLAILYRYDAIRPWYFWLVFIVIFREFTVTSLRLVVVNSSGIVVAANMLGKIKTTMQIVSVLAVLMEPVIYRLFLPEGGARDFLLQWIPLSLVSSFLAALFTLLSGINYLRIYGRHLTQSM